MHGLSNEREFVDLVERERLRTERSGRQFCLLHIGENAPAADLAEVARRIEQRTMRGTDTAGKFRDGVGVLLPETEWNGAQRVSRELLSGLTLSCQIYVFPSDDLPEFAGPGGRREGDHASRGRGAGQGSSRRLEPTSATASARDLQPIPLEALMTVHTPLWKRSFDVVGATAGLAALAPVLLATALAVRLTSRGPILFTQLRAGQGGRPFKMYKFRSMKVGAELEQARLRSHSEQDGPAFKLKHDPRITWIGRYLRKSCVDELPQLWNVLRGEMSLVGPRPLPLDESARVEAWQRRRLSVRPGLTCIWQVEGGSDVKFKDWMRMDIRYIKRRTPWHDLGLIVRTALNVVLHRASH